MAYLQEMSQAPHIMAVVDHFPQFRGVVVNHPIQQSHTEA